MNRSSLTNHHSDEWLIAHFQQPTHPELLALLYERYARKVFHKCLSMTGDVERAQDYTQDIFVRVWSKLHQFEQRSRFSTWLYAITHRYCLDQLKLAQRFSLETLTEEISGRLSDREESEEFQDRLTELEILLTKLTDEERWLLQAKYEHRRTVAELAQQYGLTESALKMRLKRSRQKIQRKMDSNV